MISDLNPNHPMGYFKNFLTRNSSISHQITKIKKKRGRNRWDIVSINCLNRHIAISQKCHIKK
jgi:hypothetical protein